MEYIKLALVFITKAIVLFGLISKVLEVMADMLCKLSDFTGKPMQ
jgi:hypothetical protein